MQFENLTVGVVSLGAIFVLILGLLRYIWEKQEARIDAVRKDVDAKPSIEYVQRVADEVMRTREDVQRLEERQRGEVERLREEYIKSIDALKQDMHRMFNEYRKDLQERTDIILQALKARDE